MFILLGKVRTLEGAADEEDAKCCNLLCINVTVILENQGV